MAEADKIESQRASNLSELLGCGNRLNIDRRGIIMNENELRKQMIENAKQAGYYKGLLEGIMCQATDIGEYYRISAEVFKKVENAVKEFEDGKVE